MLRLLNFWRLRVCRKEEFTIEYYRTIFGGAVITSIRVNYPDHPYDWAMETGVD